MNIGSRCVEFSFCLSYNTLNDCNYDKRRIDDLYKTARDTLVGVCHFSANSRWNFTRLDYIDVGETGGVSAASELADLLYCFEPEFCEFLNRAVVIVDGEEHDILPSLNGEQSVPESIHAPLKVTKRRESFFDQRVEHNSSGMRALRMHEIARVWRDSNSRKDIDDLV